MSTKRLVTLVDDIDGTEAESTVRFGLDGAAYEIDLNRGHEGDLRDALSKFIAAARKAGTPPTRGRGARPVARAGRPPRPAAPAEATGTTAIAFVAANGLDGADRRSAVRVWARGPGAEAVKAAGLDEVAERGRIAVKVYELYDARPR